MSKLKNKYIANRCDFLPTTKEDMEKRNWDELDFLLISGDAYVDHPSFGAAIISRTLEFEGFRVGIIAQPNWKSTEDFARMGKPRLAVMVTAGNLDSMVNHYTASGSKRRFDNYSPGGRMGLRPDRATIVYCNRIRELWKDIPLIIGGIEASLRRIAHYDYWSNSVRRSILTDSRADILVFGMGELAITEVARELAEGKPVEALRNIDGICWKTHNSDNAKDAVVLPSYKEVVADKKIFSEAFKMFYLEQNSFSGRRLIQDQGAWYVVQNRPSRPLTEKELDVVHSYSYARAWHPVYNKAGGVPAFDEVEFSIVSHRGCFGECSFCALVSHQGRIIQRRSDDSMISEAKEMIGSSGFKGYISDVGGPTANFMTMACPEQSVRGACVNKSCLYPNPCGKLKPDHSAFISLLRKLRKLPGIKKVFVRSGLRYDYILADENQGFLEELCQYHVSGQLKVAPEHVSENVLKYMKKPSKEVTSEFFTKYQAINEKLGLKQFLVPYYMASHPGSTLEDALELALYIKSTGIRPEQVQNFTPTPGSMSTCMYYTGLDPMTNASVYVARSFDERKMQRALLQYWMPENYTTVKKALEKLGRTDLIGNRQNCLLSDRRGSVK